MQHQSVLLEAIPFDLPVRLALPAGESSGISVFLTILVVKQFFARVEDRVARQVTRTNLAQAVYDFYVADAQLARAVGQAERLVLR